jgi:DNA mismatch repair protein MutS2
VDGSGGRFDEATLATLEFTDVVAQIVAHASCESGAAAAAALRPHADRARAQRELALVEDAAALFQAGGDYGFSGAKPPGDALERAELGSTLAGQELAGIAHAERALAAAVDAIRSEREPSRPLRALAQTRLDTSPLVRHLDGAVDEAGGILDTASPELAKMRRQRRIAVDDIRRRLDEIVRNPNTAKLLTDQIVTVRRDRFVVPVKSEFAGQFGGVVHDQSASGATVFIEPMACVEANNRVRTLEAAEEREVQRILAELSAAVGSRAGDLRANGRLLAHLDSIGARARWSLAKNALAPDLTAGRSVRIVRGRHPLLRHEAVPLDVDVGDAFDAIVISGPNMGGKTVVLKTIGLFCLIAYAGIPVPAGAGTSIGWFEHIACVIGDEQSIQNDLSSFSAHLRALRSAERAAGPRALVLVDEIGSGTEPGAGAALAQAFIEALLAKGARIVVTTHYTQLKVFAASRERIANASMTFEPATFRPTYVLAMGVPGQSLAFALATSLGLDAAMIERATALLGEDATNLERAFEGLAIDRERLREKAADADRESERLRGAEAQLTASAEQARTQAARFERAADEALQRAIAALREELLAKADRSERDAQRRTSRALDGADDAVKKAMIEIRESLGLSASSGIEPAPGAFAVGDRVYVRSFSQPAVVTEVYDRDVLVTMGAVKAVVARGDLTRDPATTVPAGHKGKPPGPEGTMRMASLDASASIDVRGLRVDEAVPIVEKAIDDASLAGLESIRIIHGKGTGQLARGIREFLRGYPQVASAKTAPDREGGTGVTVVTLS